MADEPAAVVDSAPVAEAAPVTDGAAATQEGVTHGDTAEQTTIETADTVDAEPDGSDPDADDAETEPSESDTPEEAKTKAQKRRERREAREAEQRERDRLEAVETYKREQETKAAEEKRANEAQAAAAEQRQRLSKYLGLPPTDTDAGELATIAQEIESLKAQALAELMNPQGLDPDEIDRTIKAKEARKVELTERGKMVGEIEEFVWNRFASDFGSAIQFPELADPATQTAYLRNPGGVRGALAAFRDAIKAFDKAESDAAIAKVKSEHTTSYKALEADRDSWRVRTAGAEVPDTTSGGTPASNGGIYTRERLRQMMQTEAGMAEYRRNKAEIARQEAAGLIR